MSKNGKWTSEDIPDQKGRTAIVTGANSGIGFEEAIALAKKNAEVILACRNKKRGEDALSRIKSEFPKANCKLMQLDLSNLKSVRKFAGEFNKNHKPLHVLINNAGVMMVPYSKTPNGFELHLGTNHLGHFALTGLLMDTLLKTKNSRIVNVSSMAHGMGNLDFDDLQWEKRKYSKMKAYGDSKLANIYFTYELKRRLEKKKLTTIAAASHPGWTATNLQRHVGFFKYMNYILGQNSEMGALPTLYAATVEDVKSGDYYGPGGFQGLRGHPKKVESSKLSHDMNIAKKLWEVSEKLTGVKYNL